MKLDLPTIDPETEGRLSVGGPRAGHGAHSRMPEDSQYEAPSIVGAVPRRRPRRLKMALAAVCVCVLAGAGVAVAAAMGAHTPEVPEVVVPAPVEEKPIAVQASVKADGVLSLGPSLSRGEKLTNVVPATDLSGAYADTYYRAVYEGKTVYIEKKWVRTADEVAPEQWTGYATADAIIYAKRDLSGDDILTLQLNEEVTVLDAFGDLLFVRNADGFEGYVPADKVMREKAEEPPANEPTANSDNYYYGGSNSGGSSGSGSGWSGGSGSSSGGGSTGGGSGGGSTGGGSTSGDGDEMTMPASAPFPFGSFLLGVGVAYADEAVDNAATSEQGVDATVLADDVQTYIAILNRGDKVEVKIDDLFGFSEEAKPGDAVAADEQEKELPQSAEDADAQGSSEDLCTIVVNGQEAKLPEKLLHLDTEPAFASWDGFALEGTVLYSDYSLTVAATELALNDSVKVIDSIGTTLVVDVEGAAFYIDGAFVSKEQIEKTEEEPPAEGADSGSIGNNGYSSGGGTWSGSSNGGSGSSGSSGGSSGGGGSSSGGSTGGGGSSGSGGGSDGGGSSGSGGSGSEDEWTAPQL